jgi:N-acetylglutamate synthase-like GNAT family acetyltransferase
VERLQCDIRLMRPGDESVLYLLAEQNLRPLASQSGHPERYHPDELLHLLRDAEVFIAEADDEVAGYVAVEDDAGDLIVRCLCVSPAHEAQAVAHQLLEWVEGLAFNRGARRLEAFVPAADEASRHLYQRHDFSGVPESDRPELIVMEKRLPEP